MTRGKLAGCALGEVLKGRSVKLTPSRILAFSGGAFDEPGWPHRNIHTDREKARDAGLPDAIASGTQSEGVLLTHLVDLIGPSWHDRGELEAKFIKSAFMNDEITPVAVVREIRDGADGKTVGLEVWCETQSGERIIVGRASGPLAGC